MKLQCPRCRRVYECTGEPTQNPGGLGARAGWTCIGCVDEPPRRVRVAYAKAAGNLFAACWIPVYLEPYKGDAEPDFTYFTMTEAQCEIARKCGWPA
jgi:hypothetical protein